MYWLIDWLIGWLGWIVKASSLLSSIYESLNISLEVEAVRSSDRSAVNVERCRDPFIWSVWRRIPIHQALTLVTSLVVTAVGPCTQRYRRSICFAPARLPCHPRSSSGRPFELSLIRRGALFGPVLLLLLLLLRMPRPTGPIDFSRGGWSSCACRFRPQQQLSDVRCVRTMTNCASVSLSEWPPVTGRKVFLWTYIKCAD